MFELMTVLAKDDSRTVYKARESESGRILALKVVELNSPHAELAARRLQREGRILARFQHPAILEWHGADEVNGRMWLAMELAQGTLAQCLILPRSPLEASYIVESIANAVATLHDYNVVHHAVDVYHTFVAMNGMPKLGGFGRAQVPGPSNDGETGMDIRDLGRLLFELLAGHAPPGAGHVSLPASVPAQVAAICLSCLGDNKGPRYSDAAAVARDLRTFLGNHCPTGLSADMEGEGKGSRVEE